MSINEQSSKRSALEILSRTLRHLREEQRLTIAQLAGYAGFHPSVLELIEDGVWVPDQDEVILLCKALGVPWINLAFLAAVAEYQNGNPHYRARRRRL
jgi:transcriptional regulator with XRE-family HTH domain